MWWKMYELQDSSTPISENLLFFHDHAMMIIILIMLMIMYLIINLLKNKFNNKSILQNQFIEIIWTIIPMIILSILAIPSLKILYLTDEIKNPFMTIKIIGHQWYWSYEYSEFNNLMLDSFMIYKYNINFYRLLDVDSRMIVPYNYEIRLLITSIDVIHSWTIPSMGIKIDAIPGRINQTMLFIKRPGIYYGQCSEICGINHSFMPIVLESTSKSFFYQWIKDMNK